MLKLLRIEAVKLLRDRAIRWILLGFMASPVIIVLMFIFARGDLVRRGVWNAEFFFNQVLGGQVILLAPMMLAVLGAQLVTIEYRQKTLKGLLPLPVSLPGLFAAKAVWGFIILGLGLLLAGAATALFPTILGLPPSGALIQALLRDSAILWITYPAYLLFTMVTGLFSKNFVAPLAVSAAAVAGGILAVQGGRGQYIWTSIPTLLLSGKEDASGFTRSLAISFVYTLGFLALGLLKAKLTRRPE